MTLPQWPSREQHDALKSRVEQLRVDPNTIPGEILQAAQAATADLTGLKVSTQLAADEATARAQEAALAAQIAFASAYTLPQFRSTSTANPTKPTALDLASFPAICGSRIGPTGGVEQLLWTPHTALGAWVVVVPEGLTPAQAAEVQAALDVPGNAAESILNLNGIRALVATPEKVVLGDTVPGRFTPSTYVTPGGFTIPTVKVNAPFVGSVEVLRADALEDLIPASPDTAAPAAGATATGAELNALRAELRDLKTQMRACGLLKD